MAKTTYIHPVRDTPAEESVEKIWPHCPELEGNCILFDLSRVLGADLLNELLQFVWEAQEGAKLTMQRN